MKSRSILPLAAVLLLVGAGCWDGSGASVPEPYEASVRGVWRLSYGPTELYLSEGGREDVRGVLGGEPIEWKGGTVTLDCADSRLLCPEEVLGAGEDLLAIEETDPSELLFPVAVQPTTCSAEERRAAGGAPCGDVLLPAEQQTINVRLPSDGSTFFMPRDDMEELRRACYARTEVELEFHDVVEGEVDGGLPQARRVSGDVTVRIDPACLVDDQGRRLARFGANAELRMETTLTGTWAPPPE